MPGRELIYDNIIKKNYLHLVLSKTGCLVKTNSSLNICFCSCCFLYIGPKVIFFPVEYYRRKKKYFCFSDP